MGRFLRNVFGAESGNLTTFGMIVLVVFFILLVAIIVVTLMRKKSYDEYDANLPLDDQSTIKTNINN